MPSHASFAPARGSVLVADADPEINRLLTHTMREAGYEARRAFDGLEAKRAIELRPPRLLLLDVDLPHTDGLEIVRHLRRRESPTIGVIIVSGRRAEHHRLAGFAAGADDYVVKPFSAAEIAARAAAILRRLSTHAQPTQAPLISGPLRIDGAAQRVTNNGALVPLSRIEYRLLLDLASQPNIARSRKQLVDAAWGDQLRADPRTVTVHVQRLRRKLLSAGSQPGLIQTVHGVGYRFEPRAT